MLALWVIVSVLFGCLLGQMAEHMRIRERVGEREVALAEREASVRAREQEWE